MNTSEMEIVPVASVGVHNLVGLFNDAYSQYYTEVKVNAGSLAALVYREDICPERSFVAIKQDTPVGIVFLAIRGDHGYICGMGVRQRFQGQGIGELLMRRALEECVSLDLVSVQLEVVDANFRAAALYRKLGFQRVRDVGVFACDSPDAGEAVNSESGLELGTVRAADAVHLVAAFNEMAPAWQNQPASVLKFPGRFSSIVASANGRVLGYLLYGAAGQDLLVADTAASPGLSYSKRHDVVVAMLNEACSKVAPLGARGYNIPVGGYQEEAMVSAGYEVTLALQEMVLCLRSL